MKYNLKNRPHIEVKRKGDKYSTKEWFEGFEEELRGRQARPGSQSINIKEILGE